MPCILNIETSTEVCSMAVTENGNPVFNKENYDGPSHSVLLGVFIDEALSFTDSCGMILDAVAVSCGPGSYTGLRIGVSMAKGICYGRDIPLIAVPTLKLLSVPVLLYQDLPDDALLCPMIDARRMEVYAAVYDRALRVEREVAADIVDENSYLSFLEEHPVYFFGNGADKCRTIITHPNVRFLEKIVPLAKMMSPLSERAFMDEDFSDVAYFEPFYLKDFVATKPKNTLEV
ncbi:MAG: tRNA (adenosine(37)-N6)-threonylcarbamoyltransferase complex dimerization subunit type 1 TsaB [Bacteroides sp.]|nr:tRNA (adenosine(37)-N6)-threonylcarbamoyltransferase complex dimerization subunit type 1 TsaB [Bacteroides sp.]